MADTLPYLPQRLVDQYIANWVEVISLPNAAALQASFLQDGELITGVGFAIEHVAQLVATVGAVHIKARFILQPPSGTPPGTPLQFSLVLFATDSLDARVSSYYVPQAVYTDTTAHARPSRPGKSAVHKNQLHYVLAERWRQNWAAVKSTAVSPDYFDSHYGPLRGYTYELNEFVAVFLLLKELGDTMLAAQFVLHDYYRPDPTTGGDELAKTFALALRLKRQDKPKGDDGAGDDDYGDNDDPIMNNGMPCPPRC